MDEKGTTMETIGEWVEAISDFDNETHYRQTDDPRVIVAITRDPSYEREWFMDGDLINPTYYYDRRGINYQGGDRDDDLAEAFVRSRQAFRYREHSDRFLRIFHEAEYVTANEPGDRDGEWIIFSSKSFVEKTRSSVSSIAEDAQSWADEVQRWLDGDVWTVKTLVNERRLMLDVPVDYAEFEEWEQVGGFVGEEYAKREAGQLAAGEPVLPEMIEMGA